MSTSRLPPGVGVVPPTDVATHLIAPTAPTRVPEVRRDRRLEALEAYRTETGFDLASAIRDGHPPRELAELFGERHVQQAIEVSQMFETLEPFKTEEGYDIDAALESGISSEMLQRYFGADSMVRVQQFIEVRKQLEPFKTEEGYDLAEAIKAGIPPETLEQLFDKTALVYASSVADALKILEPYETEGSYNIVEALEAGVSPSLLLVLFSTNLVDEAKLTTEAKEALEPFRTDEGYDIIEALEAGVSSETLQVFFEEGALVRALEVQSAKTQLESYITDEGYNVVGAIEAGISTEVLQTLFEVDVVEAAQQIVSAKTQLESYITDEGYNIVEALEANIPIETLQTLFDASTIEQAQQVVSAKMQLESYTTDKGYNIVEALEAGIPIETLQVLFSDENITQAQSVIGAKVQLERYTTDEGYSIVDALEDGISLETLQVLFSEDAISQAQFVVSAKDQMKTHETDLGYDIVDALESGMSLEVLQVLFSDDAISQAQSVIYAKEQLEDYVTDGEYDLVGAIEGGVSSDVLLNLFSEQAVQDALSITSTIQDLSDYKDDDGYDIVRALRDGVAPTMLHVLFSEEIVSQAQNIVSTEEVLLDHKTEEGYDIVGALEADVSVETLQVLFSEDAISQAQLVVSVKEQMKPFETEDGYDLLGAIEGGTTDEVLAVLFGTEAVVSAHNFIDENVKVGDEWIPKEAFDRLTPAMQSAVLSDGLEAISIKGLTAAQKFDKYVLWGLIPSDAEYSGEFEGEPTYYTAEQISARNEFEAAHVYVGPSGSKVWISNEHWSDMTTQMQNVVSSEGIQALDTTGLTARQKFDKYVDWGLVPAGSEYAADKGGEPTYYTSEQVKEMDQRALEKWNAALQASKPGDVVPTLHTFKILERNPEIAAWAETKEYLDDLGVAAPTLHTFKIAQEEGFLGDYLETIQEIKADHAFYHPTYFDSSSPDGLFKQFFSQLYTNIAHMNLPSAVEMVWQSSVGLIGVPLTISEALAGATYRAIESPTEGFTLSPGDLAIIQMAVPIYGTVKFWDELSTPWKVASVVFDALTVLPVLRYASRVVQETARVTGKPTVESVLQHERSLSNATINELKKIESRMDPQLGKPSLVNDFTSFANAQDSYIQTTRALQDVQTLVRTMPDTVSRSIHKQAEAHLTNMRALAESDAIVLRTAADKWVDTFKRLGLAEDIMVLRQIEDLPKTIVKQTEMLVDSLRPTKEMLSQLEAQLSQARATLSTAQAKYKADASRWIDLMWDVNALESKVALIKLGDMTQMHSKLIRYNELIVSGRLTPAQMNTALESRRILMNQLDGAIKRTMEVIWPIDPVRRGGRGGGVAVIDKPSAPATSSPSGIRPATLRPATQPMTRAVSKPSGVVLTTPYVTDVPGTEIPDIIEVTETGIPVDATPVLIPEALPALTPEASPTLTPETLPTLAPDTLPALAPTISMPSIEMPSIGMPSIDAPSLEMPSVDFELSIVIPHAIVVPTEPHIAVTPLSEVTIESIASIVEHTATHVTTASDIQLIVDAVAKAVSETQARLATEAEIIAAAEVAAQQALATATETATKTQVEVKTAVDVTRPTVTRPVRRLLRPPSDLEELTKKPVTMPERIWPEGTVTWRQGLAWITVKPPYGESDMEWTDEPPVGVFVADRGTPDETVMGCPQAVFTVPVGMLEVTYDKGSLTYTRRRDTVKVQLSEVIDELEDLGLKDSDLEQAVKRLQSSKTKRQTKRRRSNERVSKNEELGELKA